mmetsp:Transcript_75843/g.177997  ORF Transcript_75843/g.177997 Transcript_75843/m.177997 type:complete len:198 (-) Transcript_75843:1203-1796(-)
MMLLNKAYNSLAWYLTRLENHRTQSKFDRHLIFKLFAFQCINNFFSFFWLALASPCRATDLGDLHRQQDAGESQCEHGTAMNLLAFQLGTVFTIKQIINNFSEIGVPWLLMKLRRPMEFLLGNASTVESRPRVELAMQEWRPFDDYNELAIQFGFVVLFGAVFPLAPLLAYLNNVFEVLCALWCGRLRVRFVSTQPS